MADGGIFGGLNWQPLGWTSGPSALPTVPNAPPLPSINPFKLSGAVASPANGDIPGQVVGTSNVPSVSTDGLGNWFVRVTVVILGLILIAVGLKQLAPGILSRG